MSKPKIRNLGRRGKTVLAVLIAVMFVSVASAALLPYYGKITTTANVSQSVLLDGKDWDDPITANLDATGGCCYCFDHDLENNARIEAVINEESSSDSAYEIEYYKSTDFGQTIIIDGYSISAIITIEDLGSSVKWTVDMDESGPFGNGHAGIGLCISQDGIVPTYQIHFNDGTDSSYPWGTPLYSPWGPSGTGYNGWHSGDTNTEVSLLSWVDVTGDYYYVPGNPNLIFTIEIDKTHLVGPCNCGFRWAIQLVGNTCDTQYPDTWVKWSGDATGYEALAICESFDFPITLQPGELFDFTMCYKFNIAAMPGIYNIVTKFVPAP